LANSAVRIRRRSLQPFLIRAMWYLQPIRGS
jgi:hypothetical protein